MIEGQRFRVLYLHPAKQRVGFPFGDPRLEYVAPFTLMPVGVIGLLNLLQQEGFSVRGLNYPAERFIDAGFSLSDWLHNIDPPRLVLIDLHWYEHSFGALGMARVCKGLFPDAYVVLGGLTASFFAQEILDEFGFVDCIIRGDAEEPLRQLALLLCSGGASRQSLSVLPNLSYRIGSQLVENELRYRALPEELDRLDFVTLDFLEHAQQYLGFQYVGRRDVFLPDEQAQLRGHWLSIGRGCGFDCSFCGGSRTSHKVLAQRDGLVKRSVGALVKDITALRDIGVHQVALSLDPEIAGRSYWRSLFSELGRRQVRIGLYNEAFQLPSPGFVQAFADCADLSHSQLGLSLLSGDEGVRRLNGKHFSNRDLFKVLRTFKRHRVPIAIYYSFNLPGQNEATMRATIALSERICREYPPELLMMYNQPHTLDPCSPMSCNPDKYGIDIQFRSFKDYYNYCRQTEIEKSGVLGLDHRGFIWRGRTRSDERKMQELWLDFARKQTFPCF